MTYVYTARHVAAQEALGVGLCSRVVPAERLAEAAEELALSIAGRDALALRVQKDIMNHWLTNDPLTASDYSVDGQLSFLGPAPRMTRSPASSTAPDPPNPDSRG